MTSVYLKCNYCPAVVDRLPQDHGSFVGRGTFPKVGGHIAREFARTKGWQCTGEIDLDICPDCIHRIGGAAARFGSILVRPSPIMPEGSYAVAKNGTIVWTGRSAEEPPHKVDFDEMVLSPPDYEAATRALAQLGPRVISAG